MTQPPVAVDRYPPKLSARERAYMRAYELVVDIQSGVPGAGDAIDALLAEAEARDWPEVTRVALFANASAARQVGTGQRRAAVARLLARAEDDGASVMLALALAMRATLDISEASPELAMTADDDLARATVMLESADGPLMERISAHNQCAQAFAARWLWELCDEQYAMALKLAPDPPASWARYVLPAIVFNRAEMQVDWACVHRQAGEHDMLAERWHTWETVMSASGTEGMPRAWVVELEALGLLLSALVGQDMSERAQEMLPSVRPADHPGAWPVGWLHLAIAVSDQRAGRLDSARNAVELAMAEIDRSGSADPYDLALFLAAELEAEGRSTAGMRFARHELALRWSHRTAGLSSMLKRIQAERLRREHDVVTQQAHVDDLTTLLNRRGFSRYIESLAQQDLESVSLLVADLDNFKSVNDRYGHQIGDTVLVSVGRMLHALVRQSDCAVRLGGDEFALVLASAGIDAGRRRAEALIADVRQQPWGNLAPGLAITMSVGLASGRSTELPSLIERADRALYEAKANGRNRVVWDVISDRMRAVGPPVGQPVPPVGDASTVPGTPRRSATESSEASGSPQHARRLLAPAAKGSPAGPDGHREADPTPLGEIVQLANQHLQLDAVGIVEVRGASGVIRAWAGTGGFAVDAEVPVRGSYPELLLRGAVPSLVVDADDYPQMRRAPLTAWLGARSFVGVPLRLSDGPIYGVLVGISCSPDIEPGHRDVRFLQMIGELIRPRIDAQRRLDDLRTELKNVIETERISIAYQPIVELSSGRCLGVEALSRFDEPFSNPAETFAAAGRTGLGLELEGLAVSRAWPALGSLGADQFLALNVSPAGLEGLAPRARARPEVDLRQIVVELTEHAIVGSYDRLRSQLRPLRARGLRLAVDDAGAGYASLHHIVELEPDIVKVDISLVRGVGLSHARQVAVKSFVTLSEDLGATIVAEGIETPADLESLLGLGVTAGQGYLLARPSTNAPDLHKWLTTEPRGIDGWSEARPHGQESRKHRRLRVVS